MTTPTPSASIATGSGASPSSSQKPAAASGSDSANPLSMVFVEVIGVGVLAGVASIGPRIGKILAIIMVGVLVLWFVTHATTLTKLIPGTNAPQG